ncbi:hypothetical protein OAO18_02095 [Francisellaceae bacterium]|nr:hypothetical protein [Francisellaceae bacterium]
MSIEITLPKWYDLHTHLRQDALLPAVINDQIKAGCAGVLAMPNTKPPVAKIHENSPLPYWSIESYFQSIINNGGDCFDQIIVPLYLTKDTTPVMIETGAKSGLLKACKYYPPHGTTNSEHGCGFDHFVQNGVFHAMQTHGIVLCVHGEQSGIDSAHYFGRETNAEEAFYKNEMPTLHEQLPNLKIVCEHLTTKIATDFVLNANENVAATVTPQHLLFNIADLLQGLKYHLYCLPLLKFEQDRLALLDAVTSAGNTKFFAGTDSAPHTTKATACGCAAGCYSAPIAPQLYIKAFEGAGLNMSELKNQKIFKKFLCELGPQFYHFPVSKETFTLIKERESLEITKTQLGDLIPLLIGLNPAHEANGTELDWKIKI